MAKKGHFNQFGREDALTKREKQAADRRRIAEHFGIDPEKVTAKMVSRLLERQTQYNQRGLVS